MNPQLQIPARNLARGVEGLDHDRRVVGHHRQVPASSGEGLPGRHLQ